MGRMSQATIMGRQAASWVALADSNFTSRKDMVDVVIHLRRTGINDGRYRIVFFLSRVAFDMAYPTLHE
jgi:hypothetical protein